MKRVALTGGIATGKSSARAEFERLGVPTIDADDLARDVVAPGTAGLAAIVDRFGTRVLDEHQALDRRKLGTIVFADERARRDLERIVHPAVQAAIDGWFDSLEKASQPLAIAVIPLLFETGRESDFDVVITTACGSDLQLRRVMTRDRLDEEQARQRIAAQLPAEERVRRSHYVLRTDDSLENTRAQVRDVLDALTSRTL